MYQQVIGQVYEEHAPCHRPERRIDFIGQAMRNVKGARGLDRIHDLGYACVERFQRIRPRRWSTKV